MGPNTPDIQSTTPPIVETQTSATAVSPDTQAPGTPTPTAERSSFTPSTETLYARGDAIIYADQRVNLVGPDGTLLPEAIQDKILEGVRLEASDRLTRQAMNQREGKPVDPKEIDLANILWGRMVDTMQNLNQSAKTSPVATAA